MNSRTYVQLSIPLDSFWTWHTHCRALAWGRILGTALALCKEHARSWALCWPRSCTMQSACHTCGGPYSHAIHVPNTLRLTSGTVLATRARVPLYSALRALTHTVYSVHLGHSPCHATHLMSPCLATPPLTPGHPPRPPPGENTLTYLERTKNLLFP